MNRQFIKSKSKLTHGLFSEFQRLNNLSIPTMRLVNIRFIKKLTSLIECASNKSEHCSISVFSECL